MKIAIYSGSIPSTTFIERLIVGLAESGIEILLHGYLEESLSYNSKNIAVIGFRGIIGKTWLALKYGALFLLARPRQFYQLTQCYVRSRSAKSFAKWFVQAAPIIWTKPDVFHLQWAKSIEDWMFLQEFGIKVVLSLRGAHINYSPIVDKERADSYSRTFPDVDAFHGVCNAICREAEKYGANPEKCNVVYSGLNLEEFSFQEKKDFDRNKIKIISVGRPHWKKGCDIALDAVKILQEKGLEFNYKIFGGNSEELIFQISDLGLENYVYLEDLVSFKEVKSSIADSDILLLPSVEEGIPNVVLEAMALGAIVISTDCGGVSEVIEDNKNGFLVPIRNPLSISNKIEEVKDLTSEELGRIRQNARTTVETQHGHQKMVDDMKNLYLSVK